MERKGKEGRWAGQAGQGRDAVISRDLRTWPQGLTLLRERPVAIWRHSAPGEGWSACKGRAAGGPLGEQCRGVLLEQSEWERRGSSLV